MEQNLVLPLAGVNNYWYLDRQTQSVIVFVHGIFSDSRDCWSHVDEKDPSKSRYWPALIESDSRLAGASVYMGGYYTAVAAGPYEIRNCADEMFRAMNRIDEAGCSPVMKRERILFVCHSTGGIVVRYLLEYYVEQFRNKCVGLLLIASPSYGSKWADKLSLLSGFYNQRLGTQLQWGNWSLRDLDARFKDLINNRELPSFIGIEAYENRFVIHRKWLPDSAVVVTEESAGRYFGAPVLLRGTDHFSSVKPTDTKHPTHELLVDFWHRFQQLSPPRLVSSDQGRDRAQDSTSAASATIGTAESVKPKKTKPAPSLSFTVSYLNARANWIAISAINAFCLNKSGAEHEVLVKYLRASDLDFTLAELNRTASQAGWPSSGTLNNLNIINSSEWLGDAVSTFFAKAPGEDVRNKSLNSLVAEIENLAKEIFIEANHAKADLGMVLLGNQIGKIEVLLRLAACGETLEPAS
jgi:hypothetical protein